MGVSDIAARVRREEYTGENRCLPCTALNVCLAAAAGAGVWWVVGPWVAAVVVLACLTAIYFRGYLVPGTPTVTRRYLPAPVLALFGKEPNGGVGGRGEAAEAAGFAGVLQDAGVLETLDGSGEARLGEQFRREWRDAIEAVRDREREASDATTAEVGAADVAATLGAADCTAQSDLSFEVAGEQLVRWESRAALLADVAAASVLAARVDAWKRLDRSARLDVLAVLRTLLDRCPRCDARTARTEREFDACCQRPHSVLESTCEDCGATVAEIAVADPDDETPLRRQFLRG